MKKYIAIDAINGEQEEFDTIEEARTWITDIIQDDNELHPDAESCYITQVVEEIRVVESLEISDYHEVKFVPYDNR